MLTRLRADLRLIGLGLRAELRNPGIWVPAVLAGLLTAALGWNARDVAPTQSVVLALRLGQAYGLAATLWFAYRAIRDQDQQLGAVLRSKPVESARWVVINWLTGAVLWVALLGVAVLAATLIQLPVAGGKAVVSQAATFYRAGFMVVIISAISYALSRVLRSPLGGIIVLLAWGLAVGGFEYVPVYLRPDYSQNRPLLIALGAALMALCALVIERMRRGELRKPAVPVTIVAVLILLTSVGAANAYRASSVKDLPVGSLSEQIRIQHMVKGMRTPGFWLPDGAGGWVRSADYQGKILILCLFSADDFEAGRTLQAMEAVYRQYRDKGVQPIGICLSTDYEDSLQLARAGGYSFPIAGDPSTMKTASPPSAVTVDAYDIDQLPQLFITDRHRVVREVIKEPRIDVSELQSLITQRLAEEPE
jgi:peroxiredoxin